MSESPKPNTKFPYSIAGPYYMDILLGECLSVPEGTETLITLHRNLHSGGQFANVIESLAKIDSVHREICLALNDFTPRPVDLFADTLTIEQLTLSLKLYVVCWATLLDMIAGLINKIFDLGFDDRDITFELISRNKHVQNSKLPTVFKKYSKPLIFRTLSIIEMR